MSTRDVIVSAFKQVADDHGQRLTALADDTVVAECGLDSMSVAIVVSHLEDSLGVDPFTKDQWVDFPMTFGELVRLYEREMDGNPPAMAFDQRNQYSFESSKRFGS